MSYTAKYLAQRYQFSPTHIIHVGAWEGLDVPEYLEMKVPRVTLIEALPEKANLLRTKYSRNRNVEIFEFAATDKANEVVTFYLLNYGSSSLLKPNIDSLREIFSDFTEMEPIKVRTMILDSIESTFDEDIMLVIDVQGAELKVLFGSVETLKRTHLIKIEVSTVEYYKGQSNQQQIEEFIKSKGFVKVSQRISKKIKQGDAIFLRKKDVRVLQFVLGRISDLRWKLSIQKINFHLVGRILKLK